MNYIPKKIRCKLKFKDLTDEEIREHCFSSSEFGGIKKFYQKLDGMEVYLVLWKYDNYKYYHLSTWKNEVDKIMMEAFWIFEKELGAYSDYENFKNDWKNGEYDCGRSIVFPQKCAEELEVISEEVDESTPNEQLEMLNDMEVVEHSFSCGECEYILVVDNEKNRNILSRLGFTKGEIEEECNPDGEHLDISSICSRFATHYNQKKKSFYIEHIGL